MQFAAFGKVFDIEIIKNNFHFSRTDRKDTLLLYFQT